jgi:uncharacterized protein YoxC
MNLELSVTIIAVVLTLSSLFFIVALYKAMTVLTETRRLVEMIRLQIAPITHDLTQIIGDVRSIVKTTEKEMDKVSESIAHVRDTTRNLRDFEHLLQERIERPLLDVTAVMAAVLKGSRVFFRQLSRK